MHSDTLRVWARCTRRRDLASRQTSSLETDDAPHTVRGKQGCAACRPKACKRRQAVLCGQPSYMVTPKTWPSRHHSGALGHSWRDKPSEGTKKRGSGHVPIVAAAVMGEVAVQSGSALFLLRSGPPPALLLSGSWG